jgi:hypothetical protein
MSSVYIEANPRAKRWTGAVLANVAEALKTLTTDAIAPQYGVNGKTLRSALARNGIKVYDVRPHRERYKPKARNGLALSGVTDARPAADALEALPDNACRWPIGEVNSPDFRFCGCKKLPGRSYCACHGAAAYDMQATKESFERGEGRLKSSIENWKERVRDEQELNFSYSAKKFRKWVANA